MGGEPDTGRQLLTREIVTSPRIYQASELSSGITLTQRFARIPSNLTHFAPRRHCFEHFSKPSGTVNRLLLSILILTHIHTHIMMCLWESRREITANLPEELLTEACEVTGKGITETLIQGLELVRRSMAAKKAQRLRGKLKLEIDLETSRERPNS